MRLFAVLLAILFKICGCGGHHHADADHQQPPKPRHPVAHAVSRSKVRHPLAHSKPKPHHRLRLHPRLVSCTTTPDERWIIQRESGGDTQAWNPAETSTGHAFGIGQLTDDQRAHFGRLLGINPNSTSFCDQLRLMKAYIRSRYGTEANAVAHWRLVGWY